MKILLVEDHSGSRRNLQRLIARRGHDVTAVGSAEEAETALATETFPFLILDWMLPGKSGVDPGYALEACLELEAEGAEFHPGTARVIATKKPAGCANQSCHSTSPLVCEDLRVAARLHSRCDADHKNALSSAVPTAPRKRANPSRRATVHNGHERSDVGSMQPSRRPNQR